MKHTMKKVLALALACSMLLSVSALAAPAYGDELFDRSVMLHDGVELHRQAHWSNYYNDLRQEYYVTYSPSEAVRPVAMYGSAVTNRLTATEAAAQLEQEGKRVVFGVNGDYFDSNGTPTGILISDGKLLSSDAGNYAIGFDADGGVVIGRPLLSLLASVNYGEGYYLSALNKTRVSDAGIFAYTYDFNPAHTTGTTEPGVDVVLEPLTMEETRAALEQEALLKASEELQTPIEMFTPFQRATALQKATYPAALSDGPSIGEKVWYKVVRVMETSTPTSISQGQLVLSANAKTTGTELSYLRAMKAGDILSIDTAGNGSVWNGVTEAVGGLYPLVEKGRVLSGLGTSNGPRTAVGVKENGDVVLYTVDGRRGGYSIGSSFNTLAQRMVELGCVTAICFDGGGSTTAIASMPDSNTVSLLNRPSDNAERKVSSLLFLVSDEKPLNHASRLYLDTDNPYVLAGTSITLRSALVDQNHYPLSTVPTLTASAGSISESNVFTAPATGGEVKIIASAQGRTTALYLTVVDTPDELRLYRDGTRLTELTVSPGESVALSLTALYKHLALSSQNSAFTWSVSENVGSVDKNGVFTASPTGGKGTLQVSKGSLTLTIPVTVTNNPLQTLEDFETDSVLRDGFNTSVSFVDGGDLVRFGKTSMRLDYSGVDTGGAAATLDLTQPAGYDLLTFSVLGDGSGNTLSLYDSEQNITAAAVLDFTGWREISVPVTPGTRFTALTIQGATGAGTIYVDQFVASYDNIVDTGVPVITGTLENGALTAAVSDEVDGKLTGEGISLLCDGKALESAAYTVSEGAVSADLSALLSDGKSHRVTLTAQDASGNRSRMSWDIAAGSAGAMPFVDCFNGDGTPHWANSNIQYFYDQGLLAGYDVDGQLYARPNNNMTRAEFAVLLFRYLGLDGRDYQEADVPYADLSRIDPWALDAAKAMYVLGIMKGSAAADGKTYFSPNATITRAQAITMLGRLQEKGYTTAELSAFTDAADVPDWAAQHLKTMVAQGVINGSDGKLNPNAAMTRAQALKILSLMR